MKKIFLSLSILSLVGCFSSQKPKTMIDESLKITEGPKYITVLSQAPVPAEVQNKTQALALAREAAIATGQVQLLTYILSKKTDSGKALEEAEHPYLELQEKVRGIVKGAQIEKTKYVDDICHVTMSISRKAIKEILKDN